MALNYAVILGRLTQDPDLKSTQSGTSVCTFTVAVDRNFAKEGEEKQTDFISCVAWKKTAEFVASNFSKGRMIAVEGNLRTRTYEDKNGSKHYVTELYASQVSFTGEPKKQIERSTAYETDYDNAAVLEEEVLSEDGCPF